jgi:hypothetical protein
MTIARLGAYCREPKLVSVELPGNGDSEYGSDTSVKEMATRNVQSVHKSLCDELCAHM